MANSWIKLYHEILSDPKMGMMSDKLFRRTIEFFLIAGKEDRDGELPAADDIAWILRISKKEVQKTIEELVRLNIISIQLDPLSEYTKSGKTEKYIITHFSERQKSDQTKSEMNRAYYEKHKLKKSEFQTEIQSENKAEIQKNSENSVSEIQTEIQCVDKNKIKNKNKNKNKIKEGEEEKNSETEIQSEFQITTPTPSLPASTKKTKAEHRDRGELKPMGKLRNVMLSEKEIRDLNQELGGVLAAKYIDKLSLYIGEPKNAKKYTDHYLTVLRWYYKDQEEQEKQEQQSQQKKTYTAAEVAEMMERGEL